MVRHELMNRKIGWDIVQLCLFISAIWLSMLSMDLLPLSSLLGILIIPSYMVRELGKGVYYEW